jgi:hypothetical protein
MRKQMSFQAMRGMLQQPSNPVEEREHALKRQSSHIVRLSRSPSPTEDGELSPKNDSLGVMSRGRLLSGAGQMQQSPIRTLRTDTDGFSGRLSGTQKALPNFKESDASTATVMNIRDKSPLKKE